MGCLDEDTIADLLAGRIKIDAPGVEEHLHDCPWCTRLIGLAAADFPARPIAPASAERDTLTFGNGPPPDAVTPLTAPAPKRNGSGSLSPGARLNDTYEVVRLVGRGGMGEVYEVRNVRLAGRYAVKVLRADISDNEELLSRFRREAELTSALAHPNIVQVFDFNQTPGGQWFLAMEFLAGGDLAALIKREGPLALARTLAITGQIASALTATHDRGIIHRDLKPGNVFVLDDEGTGADRIKLVDFGLSKRSVDLVTSVAYSREDALIGTPLYMAPEQALAQNRKLSTATDQYALAVLLFEMLAGKPPFHDKSLTDVLHAIAYRTPPALATLRPDLPPGVSLAIERALAKEPSDRHPTVRHFVEAVELAIAEPITLVAIPGPRRRRFPLATPAVAGVFLVLTVVGGLLWRNVVVPGWSKAGGAPAQAGTVTPASVSAAVAGSPPLWPTAGAVANPPGAQRDAGAVSNAPAMIATATGEHPPTQRGKLPRAQPRGGPARRSITEGDPNGAAPVASPAAAPEEPSVKEPEAISPGPDAGTRPRKPVVVPRNLIESL